MLSMVEARNIQGDVLTLVLSNQGSSFFVEEIEGLDPGDRSPEGRNLRFSLKLNPDYVIETPKSLRRKLYRFFMPESTSQLRFFQTDGSFVDISGKVENFEASLFTDEPRAVISILCKDDRDFTDPVFIEVPGKSSVGIADPTSVLEYEGSVNTGVILVVEADRATPSITFIHRAPDNTIRTMEIDEPLGAGDVLNVVSVFGSKGITLLRDGSSKSVLNSLSPMSRWPELMPGTNYYGVFAEDAMDVPYKLFYQNRYGGL